MKLISWNVNGIRAVHKKGFLSFVDQERPDVLSLQEIKIHENQLVEELLPPKGYTRFCSYAEKKGYSGVATYLESAVFHKEEKLQRELGSKQFDQEGRFLVTHIEDIVLYNVYIPSGTSGELRQSFKYSFLDFFLEHLKSLPKAIRKRVVLCGDFNICHRPIDIHHPAIAEKRQLSGFLPEERAWMDTFAGAGFFDTFRYVHGDEKQEFTWWSYRAGARGKNLGWRIDYFFVAEELLPRVKDAGILSSVEGSDHCPLYLELS
jgi:exodeoxyribonuclease-3